MLTVAEKSSEEIVVNKKCEKNVKKKWPTVANNICGIKLLVYPVWGQLCSSGTFQASNVSRGLRFGLRSKE